MTAGGLFVTFEGGEGTGKSVQCALLFERLNALLNGQPSKNSQHCPLLKTREPGGSPSAELIRPILTTGDKDRWLPISEALLFYAARYDHWKRRILPILQQGGIVLCDRFFDSSRVYQGLGRGLSEAFFQKLHALMEEEMKEEEAKNPPPHAFMPDLTYILDLPPQIGVARSKARQQQAAHKEERFEQIDLSFHECVRQGYIALAQKHPERCRLIDATESIADIHSRIWADFYDVFKKVQTASSKPLSAV